MRWKAEELSSTELHTKLIQYFIERIKIIFQSSYFSQSAVKIILKRLKQTIISSEWWRPLI